MKVLIIGGTGHVGRHMVPLLLAEGMNVTVLSSGRTPPPDDSPWNRVEYLQHDYQTGTLPDSVIENPPAAAVDMLGVSHTYELFREITPHIVVCGSLWMYGEPRIVPTPEVAQTIPCPFPTYVQRFEKIQQDQENAGKDGVRFTAIMPPNICGPEKVPLEGMGGRSLDVHRAHAIGQPVILPDGPDCLIGPCDAEDIARLFVLALTQPDRAAGEIFNAGAAYALAAEEFIQTIATIHGVTIPIQRVSWEEYRSEVSPDIGAHWHFKAHMCPDIRKARTMLGYEPQYRPEQTLHRAIHWMRQRDLL